MIAAGVGSRCTRIANALASCAIPATVDTRERRISWAENQRGPQARHTMQQPLSDLLTTSFAARELGESEGTVRRKADAGELPVAARLSNGTRLFRREDVMRLREIRATQHRGEQ